MKQINNKSDLISMSSFAGPSYLTTIYMIHIILTWDFVFSIFTISAKLDPFTNVWNLTNVYFI